MKYLFFLFHFIFINTCIFSQNTTWSLLINTSDDRSIADITTDEMGCVYFTGLNRQADSYHFKGIVFKLSTEGIPTDSLFLDNHDSSVIVNSILPDTMENFILGIETFGTTSEQQKCGFNLKRIDSDLNIISSSKNYLFPEEYKHININLQYNNYNNIMAFGYIFPNQIPRMFMYQINKSFDSIRAKIYLDEGAILPFFIKQLPDNNYWIVREIHPNYALIDSALNLINIEEGRIPHGMNGSYGMKWDSDTSFFLAADYFDGSRNDFTGHDVGFFHQYHPFDTTGYSNFNFTGAVDTNDQPAFYGALDYKCKDSIFIGYNKNIDIYNVHYSSRPSWYALLQTDSLLNIRWEHFYGGDAYYNLSKIIATSDGGCIMAGTRFDYITHPWVHERDIYILKVNAEGLITSANEQPASIVHDAIVYPNPGSNVLRVRVAVQHPESIFRLYNMSGKLVLQSPMHGKTAAFNTTFLPPATYVYTITAKTGLNEKGKWVKE